MQLTVLNNICGLHQTPVTLSLLNSFFCHCCFVMSHFTNGSLCGVWMKHIISPFPFQDTGCSQSLMWLYRCGHWYQQNKNATVCAKKQMNGAHDSLRFVSRLLQEKDRLISAPRVTHRAVNRRLASKLKEM